MPISDLPAYLQENEFPQDFKNLIVSLPTEKGWLANLLHQYQGFWHTTRQLQGVLSFQSHFQPQTTDIFLATTPKSGTTWLKSMAFAVLNRVRHPIPNDENCKQAGKTHPLLTTSPHVLVPFLEQAYIDRTLPPDFSELTSPRLFSTHLPFGSLPKSVVSCKIVYLCRDPKDVFVSLWHFTNKLRPKDKVENTLENVCDMFCKGVSFTGPFWDHVLGFWKESLEKPDKIMFLKYEDVKKEPENHLRRLAEFLGCPFSTEEESNGVVGEILKLCSFDNLRNLEVNKNGKLPSGEENQAFFRRGEVGDSVNYLTKEMVQRIDGITRKELHGFGLKL